jgi:hypothetical protein
MDCIHMLTISKPDDLFGWLADSHVQCRFGR